MKKTFKKLLTSLSNLSPNSPDTEQLIDKFKIGFIYCSGISKFGWTYQHDQGRKAIENRFGDQVKTSYIENIVSENDTEQAINELIADGHNMIFATSYDHMLPILRAAKNHPEIIFENVDGYMRIDNVSTYAARFYEARYLAGIVAGAMSKSNIIGYIAAFPIPGQILSINATLLGARTVNPDAIVKVIFINAWCDPEKETAASLSLIKDGADVIVQHTDSSVAALTAEENDVWVVGAASDMSQFAPTKHLTSIIDSWNHYCVRSVSAALTSSWESQETWGGFNENMLKLSPLSSSIPKEVKEKVNASRKKIRMGELHPFAGPLEDRDGITLIEWEQPNYSELLKMNRFVEGVEGEMH